MTDIKRGDLRRLVCRVVTEAQISRIWRGFNDHLSMRRGFGADLILQKIQYKIEFCFDIFIEECGESESFNSCLTSF